MEPKTDPTPEVVVSPPEHAPDLASPPPVGDLPLEPPPPLEPTPISAAKRKAAEAADYDSHSIVLISEKMKELDAANKEYEEVNAEAKALKVKWQGLNEALLSLIRERDAARGKPVERTLLNFTEVPAEPAPALPPLAEGDPLEHLWRDYPIDRWTQFGVTMKDVEKLNAGTIKTGGANPILKVGDMADWTANQANPGFERRVTDFLGIGPGAATRISDADIAFHDWWNNKGGREEFARERGIVTHADVPTAAGEGGGAAGNAGGDGGADPEAADAAREAEARVYPVEEGVATDADHYEIGAQDDAA